MKPLNNIGKTAEDMPAFIPRSLMVKPAHKQLIAVKGIATPDIETL